MPVVRFMLFHHIIFNTKYFITENLSSDCHPHHDGSNLDMTKCEEMWVNNQHPQLLCVGHRQDGNGRESGKRAGTVWMYLVSPLLYLFLLSHFLFAGTTQRTTGILSSMQSNVLVRNTSMPKFNQISSVLPSRFSTCLMFA